MEKEQTMARNKIPPALEEERKEERKEVVPSERKKELLPVPAVAEPSKSKKKKRKKKTNEEKRKEVVQNGTVKEPTPVPEHTWAPGRVAHAQPLKQSPNPYAPLRDVDPDPDVSPPVSPLKTAISISPK